MSSVASAYSEASGAGDGWWDERLAAVTSQDMARGLFLSSLLRAVRAVGDEALVERCAAVSGQSRFFDFFNYPLRLHLRMLATALPVLAERHGEAEQSLWLLGHCVAMDFLESEAGRAMQVLVRGEAKRLMNHLPAMYQVSLTGERSVKWLGPQCCRVTMKRDFLPPAFHEGMLVAMLEQMNAQRIKVVGLSVGGLESEYDLSWQ